MGLVNGGSNELLGGNSCRSKQAKSGNLLWYFFFIVATWFRNLGLEGEREGEKGREKERRREGEREKESERKIQCSSIWETILLIPSLCLLQG